MKALFDRSLKKVHRTALLKHLDHAHVFFYELGVSKLVERLQSVVHTQFRNACFIGPMSHWFVEALSKSNPHKIEALTVLDLNPHTLAYSIEQIKALRSQIRVVPLSIDEEQWGFPNDYFDLIVNNLGLHWVNEVHSVFEMWHKSLKPNGAVLGCCMAGDTLQEMRIALSLAELEREGGVSSHVSPMLDIKDIGQTLTRLHYKLVTSNADLNKLYFDDIFAIARFFSNVGESNALFARRPMISRESWVAAAAVYDQLFRETEGPYTGKLPVTLDMVHYIGWKEHESQSKPLQRGTRGIDLKTLAEEIDDDELEQGEIQDIENKIISRITRKGRGK